LSKKHFVVPGTNRIFGKKIRNMVATISKVKYEQFREMEIPDGDTHIYELLNGEIVKRASPNSPHQNLHAELFVILGSYVKQNKLGKFYSAPFDVVLDDENVPQPDIFFISKERSFIIDPEGPVMGAPDLIIEITSPGTARIDRGDKRDLYERFQVKEYWIADPKNASIEVYNLVDGRYKLLSYAAIQGEIESKALPGLGLKMEDLFG
jgi:Uma2 family endonuclease